MNLLYYVTMFCLQNHQILINKKRIYSESTMSPSLVPHDNIIHIFVNETFPIRIDISACLVEFASYNFHLLTFKKQYTSTSSELEKKIKKNNSAGN